MLLFIVRLGAIPAPRRKFRDPKTQDAGKQKRRQKERGIAHYTPKNQPLDLDWHPRRRHISGPRGRKGLRIGLRLAQVGGRRPRCGGRRPPGPGRRLRSALQLLQRPRDHLRPGGQWNAGEVRSDPAQRRSFGSVRGGNLREQRDLLRGRQRHGH